MAKKMRTPEERTIDPAAQQMLIRADELAIGTAFSRADKMSPCNIGAAGMCCKICGMGPPPHQRRRHRRLWRNHRHHPGPQPHPCHRRWLRRPF